MVRTRIAPSPTGFLHIGTARTALFNYLFARKNDGRFIMRIEDTDRERSRQEYERDIVDGLRWLGIDWDEGPDVDGSSGPYRQSERIDIYRKYLRELLEKNLIYPCYCTLEELERERELQTLAKQPPRYGGTCRKFSSEKHHACEKEGRTSTLRFKMPQEIVTITDLIRGDVTFDTATLDDIIIAKNLDTPLYNFAVVVDDYLMQITHVIRGEDHISNTPKQILLAQALGFDPPQFGHLSLILNTDRTKLSKRENKVSVLEYKKDGYLPDALINFMVLLGWSGKDDRELFTLTELEREFDLSAVHKAGAVFDTHKLDWFNAYYIRKKSMQELTALCIPYFLEAGYLKAGDLPDKYVIAATGRIIDRTVLESIVMLERERMRKLSDICATTTYLFVDQPAYDKALLLWKDMQPDDGIHNLSFVSTILETIADDNYTADHLEGVIKNAIADAGKRNGEVLWPFRVALTGLAASPSPFDLAVILGKELTLKRVKYAQELLQER